MTGRGDAGRVIAGTARGIRLAAPGPGTRPFADRVKQTLFAILEPDLRGARVLDLFAGSGAGAIEALSRGAASADLVERDAGAVRVIEENLRRAGLADRARVHRADALGWLGAREGAVRSSGSPGGPGSPGGSDDGPYDLVLLDPPYAEVDLLRRTLAVLGQGPLLTPGARVVAKHFWRDPPPASAGLLASERERRFGETTLTFYRRRDEAGAEADREETG